MNKLYYSEKQEYIGGSNLVLTGGEWVKYTEWCSTPESKSNWDDAVLVLETETYPEIKITKSSFISYSDPLLDLLKMMERWLEFTNRGGKTNDNSNRHI